VEGLELAIQCKSMGVCVCAAGNQSVSLPRRRQHVGGGGLTDSNDAPTVIVAKGRKNL